MNQLTPKLRTFRCPNCNEVINDSQSQCRFCQVPIDPGIAELVAGRQDLVNQACSDASYLQTAAVAMFVFLAVGLILGFAYWGFLITFFVVIVLLVRWQIKFSNLLTNDPDYLKAKRSKNIALILLVVAIPLGFVLGPWLELMIAAVQALR